MLGKYEAGPFGFSPRRSGAGTRDVFIGKLYDASTLGTVAESINLLRRNPLRGRFVRDGDPVVEPASILCLPNVISLVRIAFIPLMVWALLVARFDESQGWPGGWATSWAHWLGAALFVVGIATDAIDGHIARRRRLVTDLGIFLDPVADKGLTGAALVCMAIMWSPGWFWWPVVILILVREWGITWWRAVALKDRVIPAGSLGKWKTAAQGVVISVLLLFPLAVGDTALWTAWPLMLVVLALTLWSGIDYLVKAYRRTPGA